MSAAFSVIHNGRHGMTVISDNPKLDAFKQAHYLMTCGNKANVTNMHTGAYTVTAGNGIAPMTFAPQCECTECERPAAYIMHDKADHAVKIKMCTECAFGAFEAGTHESDLETDEYNV